MEKAYRAEVGPKLRFTLASPRRGLLLGLATLLGAFASAGCGQGTSASDPSAEAPAVESSKQAVTAAPAVGMEPRIVEGASEGQEGQNEPFDGSDLPQSEMKPLYTTQPPGGSWWRTCGDAYLYVNLDRFCATCRAVNGTWWRSCLNRSSCPKWCAWNNNGALRCGNC
jgi:hypothetical protein